ncbi:CPBP family intramembrane glutamic endopeptidase [Nocardioides mesophilus]|uniref:CPBP family intramembrane metalloprotease n=1 Tax=Nocardioides mesophilus TaxID=433659 RepID=A0A7G9R904_9ACTN|nr:type II CAAX endopeptidase family protein [Nocardioides mesophilus]QNN52079.1 CPBP family intramembrane metalloprotease [Nocardioides mesophilus]
MSEHTPEQGEPRPQQGAPSGSWPPPQYPSQRPAPAYPAPPTPPPDTGRQQPPYAVPGYPQGPYAGPYGAPAGQGGLPVPAAGALPSYPHPGPVPYHLMLRTWSYRWWKPLAGLALLMVLFLGVQVLVAGALFVIAAFQPGPFMDNLTKVSDLSTVTPTFLLLLNISLGALILATWAVMRVVHRMRPRWLTSVQPKMRWSFFWACIGLSVVALVASIVVGQLVPGDAGPVGDLKLNDFTLTTALLAVIVFLTTPFQAAGEEYFFRGYLMQAIGSLLGFRSDRWVQLMAKWTAIVVTALLFAAAHGAQNFPLFFDRFAFGLIAGWLVVHTGGLEAGIAMHILNNFLAFGLALMLGDISESLNVSSISWWNIPVTVTQAGVYALLVVWLARKMGLRRQTQPPVPSPESEPLPMPV